MQLDAATLITLLGLLVLEICFFFLFHDTIKQFSLAFMASAAISFTVNLFLIKR